MFILYILINAYIKIWSFSPHFTSLFPLIIEDFFCQFYMVQRLSKEIIIKKNMKKHEEIDSKGRVSYGTQKSVLK